MMPTNDKSITASEDPIESVNHSSIKLPPCWTQDTELWLLQCKAQFHMHNIQYESMKFDYIIQALPPAVIMQALVIYSWPTHRSAIPKTKRWATVTAYALQQTALSSNHVGRIPWRWETDVALGWQWPSWVGFLQRDVSGEDAICCPNCASHIAWHQHTDTNGHHCGPDDGLVLSTTINFAHIGEHGIIINIGKHFTPCVDSASTTTRVVLNYVWSWATAIEVAVTHLWQMCPLPLLPMQDVGKCQHQQVIATNSASPNARSHMFFVCDKVSAHCFMMDNGAELSIIPLSSRWSLQSQSWFHAPSHQQDTHFYIQPAPSLTQLWSTLKL